MKYKKIAFVIVSVIVILYIFTISSFAFDSNDYGVAFGQLTQNNIVLGSGLYGGVLTEPNTVGFVDFGFGASYSKDNQYDTVRYRVQLEGTFEGIVVIFYLPFYTERYIGNIQVSNTTEFYPKDTIAQTLDNYTISVQVSEVELIGTYYQYYGANSPSQITIGTVNGHGQRALRIAYQLHDTASNGGTVFVDISYQYTDVPDPAQISQVQTTGYLINFVNDYQPTINTVMGYFAQIWSFNFISVLITLSVLLAVIAILFNWGISL